MVLRSGRYAVHVRQRAHVDADERHHDRQVGNPGLLIAACIVLPQIIAAIASPAMGRLAERRGRRSVLMIGFCMLPLRGIAAVMLVLAAMPETRPKADADG